MDNIQRWSQDVGAMFKDEDGKWCHSDDVAKLESQNTELLEALKLLLAECDHQVSIGNMPYDWVSFGIARAAIVKTEGGQQ